MPDDKRGREKQAADEERRQREREVEEARERADEPEPGEQLGDLDGALEDFDYPVTTEELVEAYGDYEVQTRDGWTSVDGVLDPADDRTYDSADDARSHIRGLIHR